MTTQLVPKTVQCKCGHSFESSINKAWCQKCCSPVFYHEKDQRSYKFGNYYMYTMIATAIMFVAYLFIEMIAKPLLSMSM